MEGQLPYHHRDSGAARATIAQIVNDDLEILVLYLFDVIVAEIAMEDGKILNGARHDLIRAECSVSKPNMLLSRDTAAIPLTFDI